MVPSHKKRVKKFIHHLISIFFLFLLQNCAGRGTPLPELRSQIQAGFKKKAELIFETISPIIGLIDNGHGFLFVGTAAGDIYRINTEGKFERFYRGLILPDNVWLGFATSKDGNLITNCVQQNKNIIISIMPDGQIKELAVLNERVLALANDSSGRLYLATWQNEGNISISLNPRALAGAEFIVGKIFCLEPTGSLSKIYEGGIPVWLFVTKKNKLIASIWGQKGYFAPEPKNFLYADAYRSFWLNLSEKNSIYNVTEQKNLFQNSLVNSLTLFVMPEEDYLFGYGISKEGLSGFYLIEQKRPPIRLLLEDDLDKNVTALALFENAVYFGNAEGKVYMIK